MVRKAQRDRLLVDLAQLIARGDGGGASTVLELLATAGLGSSSVNAALLNPAPHP